MLEFQVRVFEKKPEGLVEILDQLLFAVTPGQRDQ